MGFPGDSVVKNLPANAGDAGSISGTGRSSEEGNSHPLHYSCLGNPTDRGAWWATFHGVAKSRARLRTINRAHVSVPTSQFLLSPVSPLVSIPLFIMPMSLFLLCK